MPLLLLAYLAFIAMALPDGLLGVAWPSMRVSFGVPLSALGILLPFGIGAYVVSSSATGFLLARLGVGRLLAISTVTSSAALAGIAVAPDLWVVVCAGVFLGLGAGAIDGGLNAYAASHFGARHINWMHASYGLGATIGPLVITATLGAGLSWRWAYVSVAAIQVLLATAFACTAASWVAGRRAAAETAHDAEGIGPEHGTVRRPRGRSRAVVLGAAAFAVQTAIDGGTGLWAYVFLTDGRGLPAAAAGLAVSAYWATMFVGRVVLGSVAERIGVPRILAGGVVGVIVAAVLITLATPGYVAVAGIMLVGFAAAPMFPLLTLTTADRVGARHSDQTIGVQMAASAVGGAALPAGVGVLIDQFGAGAFAPCLLALAVTMGAVYVGLRRLPPVV